MECLLQTWCSTGVSVPPFCGTGGKSKLPGNLRYVLVQLLSTADTLGIKWLRVELRAELLNAAWGTRTCGFYMVLKELCVIDFDFYLVFVYENPNHFTRRCPISEPFACELFQKPFELPPLVNAYVQWFLPKRCLNIGVYLHFAPGCLMSLFRCQDSKSPQLGTRQDSAAKRTQVHFRHFIRGHLNEYTNIEQLNLSALDQTYGLVCQQCAAPVHTHTHKELYLFRLLRPL